MPAELPQDLIDILEEGGDALEEAGVPTDENTPRLLLTWYEDIEATLADHEQRITDLE